MWQWLINLKFGVTVSRDKQITKQLEEAIYVVTQAAMVDRIIINSLSMDRMLKEQKTNEYRQKELFQEHLTRESGRRNVSASNEEQLGADKF